MLGQSKTAHQAEIDAACELIDFWRFNAEFMPRIYEEQPISSPGVWNRMEYRPLEGFVFAVTPFNFTAIGGNLPTRAGADGQHRRLEAGLDGDALRATTRMRLLEEAGLPPGVINLVYGSGADDRRRGAREPGARRHPLHRLDRRLPAHVEDDRRRTSRSYRNYPRIVGETGGKDFIVAHPSADVDAVATAIVRGSFEYQGQKCSAASRVYVPRDAVAGAARAARRAGRASSRWATSRDFSNFMGAVIDEQLVRHAAARRSTRRRADAKREIVVGGGYDDSEGYFVEPTVIETERPGFRLLREELFGPVVTTYVYRRAKWERRRSSSSTGRRRTRSPAPSSPTTATPIDEAHDGAALRGRQLLRQRQADRRGRRPAAVRRRARVGHERQGRLDVEPDPLGQPADDQGDLRAADGLPLPVHGARRRLVGVLR